MTHRSRESRREARRTSERSSSRRLLVPIAVAVVVIVAAVGAIALSAGSDGDTGGASSARPSTSTGPIAPGTEPTVDGTPLPPFQQTAGDPAIGQPIPTVSGADFAGQPVSIELDGRPKVLLFLAHWCSHCQAEVPLVQDWIDSGQAPTDVDFVSVATAIDPTLPNYPPEAWLADARWTVPVIVDPTGTVATAYGLSAFPYWVFVGADGAVTGRLTGELPVADLETIIASLPR